MDNCEKGGYVMMNCHCVGVIPSSQYQSNTKSAKYHELNFPYTYQVNTKDGKANGHPLNANDYLELGYMAGRFGVDRLDGVKAMKKNDEGVVVNIHPVAKSLFEKKLDKEGIKFDLII